jgi:hypothetical protein
MTDLRARLGMLTEDDLAALLGVKPDRLAAWRSERRGPPARIHGRQAYYLQDEVVAWLRSLPTRGDDVGGRQVRITS